VQDVIHFGDEVWRHDETEGPSIESPEQTSDVRTRAECRRHQDVHIEDDPQHRVFVTEA
jgi:hypothetical protein